MGRLISRKAVEKCIKEYFKMIIDNTNDDVDCVLDYSKQISAIINEQPTAYDVDKVVEELENRASLRDRVALSISDYAERYRHIKTADAYRQATLIVKGAVKDE